MNQTTTTTGTEKTFFGHPRGLAVLFFTEMWERFSYYGMRALLVLYMTQHLLLEADKGKAILGYDGLKAFVIWWKSVFGIQASDITTQMISSEIYGLYTGFVYFTPFFGGLLADKVFGQRKSVYIGGVLMAIGHFLMASETMFFVALLFLILGNGCFKPNISTQVGFLYKDGDKRKDSAYTLFYMGINLGAFFSPLVCGALGQKVGWHYGFAAAGIGMLVGLVVYHFGRGYLPTDQMKAAVAASKDAGALTTKEWKAIGALALLCFVNVIFWSVYEQQGNTLQLWADERTNWGVIPSTFFQSFNPLFIFLFAPLLNIFWAAQAKEGKEPTSVTKMGLGCLFLGIAFVIMIAAAKMIPEGQKGSVLWLIMTTVIVTMGELYLSPIGLSLVSKVAPKRLVSAMMGMWFLSSFLGNYLSGFIGGYYELMTKDQFFALMTGLGVGAGFIFFAANKPLRSALNTETTQS